MDSTCSATRVFLWPDPSEPCPSIHVGSRSSPVPPGSCPRSPTQPQPSGPFQSCSLHSVLTTGFPQDTGRCPFPQLNSTRAWFSTCHTSSQTYSTVPLPFSPLKCSCSQVPIIRHSMISPGNLINAESPVATLIWMIFKWLCSALSTNTYLPTGRKI